MGFTDLLTQDQREKVKNMVRVAKDAMSKQTKTIKEDESGYEVLVAAVKGGDPFGDTTGINVDWDALKKGAQLIGQWANDFLKELENAPLKEQTKKEIVSVCRKYKELLETTSKELQTYRVDVHRMFTQCDNILGLLILDENSINDLKELSKEPDQLKKISEWVSENKEEFKGELLKLSELLSDKTSKEKVTAMQRNWKNLSEHIEAILQNVDGDVKQFRKKMSILSGVCLIFAATLAAAVLGSDCHLIAAALYPHVGTLGVLSFGSLASVIVSGAGVLGLFLIAEPEIARTLQLTKEVTLSAINEGLQHIASHADELGTILLKIYKDFFEVQGNDPAKDFANRFGKPNIIRLFESLTLTKANLKKLKEDIIATENVVDNELSVYGEKVYKPLLRMCN